MAIETINVGNIPNDGTGDDLREAFIKVNQNFTDVDQRITNTNASIEVENLGSTGQGTYAGTVDGVLTFKSLVAGTNTTITSNSESIVINSSGGINNILVLTDNGSITVSGSNYLGINGGDVISTRASGNNLFIDLEDTGIVAHDTSPTLSATLNADYNNIINVNAIAASSFVGPLTGLVHGVDIRTIDYYFSNWDFGGLIEQTYSSIFDYIVKNTDIDLGALVGAGVVDWDINEGAIV